MIKGASTVIKQFNHNVPFHISYQDIENEQDYRKNCYLEEGVYIIDEYILFVNTKKETALLLDKDKSSLVGIYGKNFAISKNNLWYTNTSNQPTCYSLKGIPVNKFVSVKNNEEVIFLQSGSFKTDNLILSVNNKKNCMLILEPQTHAAVIIPGTNFSLKNSQKICYTDNNDKPSSLSLSDIPINDTKNSVLLIFGK